MYAVIATVNHTVARGSLQGLSSQLGASVSELEFTDIALKNTVNLNVALASGFSEVKDPLYVTKSKPTLTLNTVVR